MTFLSHLEGSDSEATESHEEGLSPPWGRPGGWMGGPAKVSGRVPAAPDAPCAGCRFAAGLLCTVSAPSGVLSSLPVPVPWRLSPVKPAPREPRNRIIVTRFRLPFAFPSVQFGGLWYVRGVAQLPHHLILEPCLSPEKETAGALSGPALDNRQSACVPGFARSGHVGWTGSLKGARVAGLCPARCLRVWPGVASLQPASGPIPFQDRVTVPGAATAHLLVRASVGGQLDHCERCSREHSCVRFWAEGCFPCRGWVLGPPGPTRPQV